MASSGLKTLVCKHWMYVFLRDSNRAELKARGDKEKAPGVRTRCQKCFKEVRPQKWEHRNGGEKRKKKKNIFRPSTTGIGGWLNKYSCRWASCLRGCCKCVSQTSWQEEFYGLNIYIIRILNVKCKYSVQTDDYGMIFPGSHFRGTVRSEFCCLKFLFWIFFLFEFEKVRG